jgi:hypothetical protein
LEAAANRISQLEAAAQGASRSEEHAASSISASPFSAAVRPLPPTAGSPIRRLSARGAPPPRGCRPPLLRWLSPRPRRAMPPTWPWGPASASGGGGASAQMQLQLDRRGRRRGSWQSARRPVWRPWRRRSLWRRASAAGLGGSGLTGSNPTESHRDQQLLRR